MITTTKLTFAEIWILIIKQITTIKCRTQIKFFEQRFADRVFDVWPVDFQTDDIRFDTPTVINVQYLTECVKQT